MRVTFVLVVLAVSLTLPPSPESLEQCLPADIQCIVENSGVGVGIGGEIVPADPGNGIGMPPDSDGSYANPGNPGGRRANPITLCNTEDDTFPINDPLQGFCETVEDEAVIPYPTLSDLARFTPQPPTLTGEPFTAGILGKPTNFLSTASEHTLEGELFTYPVSVRFTPVEYTFDYGDGTMATVTDAYDSWAEAGLPQFTPTDASHVYSAKGDYAVSVTVSYAAEVNFAGSSAWLPVAGYVRSSTSGYGVTIYEVVTALVDKDCNEDPTGTGCP